MSKQSNASLYVSCITTRMRENYAKNMLIQHKAIAIAENFPERYTQGEEELRQHAQHTAQNTNTTEELSTLIAHYDEVLDDTKLGSKSIDVAILFTEFYMTERLAFTHDAIADNSLPDTYKVLFSYAPMQVPPKIVQQQIDRLSDRFKTIMQNKKDMFQADYAAIAPTAEYDKVWNILISAPASAYRIY
jgi:hypothetical protein